MSDQDLEEVSFNIFLSSLWWKVPPNVKISLNNELIEITEVSELKEKSEKKVISFTKQLSPGEHTITIELFNKQNNETVLDPNDPTKIVKDQLLNIEDIEIDEISLGYLTHSKSKFYPNKQRHPNLPEEITELTCIGYNGTYEIKFQVPTYIWFLENL